jgi:hypothetical protein
LGFSAAITRDSIEMTDAVKAACVTSGEGGKRPDVAWEENF